MKSIVLFIFNMVCLCAFGNCNDKIVASDFTEYDFKTGNTAGYDYSEYVNPMIGTGGHGHVFLGANVPFGFVQLGPTQHNRGWDWCSGYHYSDSIIIGFGHLHLSGTGVGDLGDIAFLPVTDAETKEAKFSHSNERVAPGYYSVVFDDTKIKTELTSTLRSGFHRYTYPETTEKQLLRIDLQQGIGWDNTMSSHLRKIDDNTIAGYRFSMGWARNQQVYFVAKFSKPVTIERYDNKIGLLSFDNDKKPLLVKVGLSAVGIDGAHNNLEEEIKAWDFDKTAVEARKKWNEELGKIKIETSDEVVKRIFYTAMYHTMTAPSVFNDVTGNYRGADGRVHNGMFTNYTTLSLWDTYRAQMPLMSLIHPDKGNDIAQTFINIYRQQGKLPVWHLMGNETNCMVGSPGIPVLADFVLKGFVNDKNAAYDALKASALYNDRGLDLLKKYDYLPYDKDSTAETVAKGLEYALADACVAQVAKLLNNKNDYEYFYNRSMSYKKYFDSRTGFMRGISSDGKFREPFNPFRATHRNDDYTEGNAWQYTWLVPHDVHGLVNLFGNEKRFVSKLDSLFIVEGDLGADASPDISGLIGQYAHGNEPSHHIIYLYNYVGQTWKAARLLRKTMHDMYGNNVDGLCGNEDVGQMSAWYVLSSMGLYQAEPAGGKFVFGSPLFDKVSMNVGNGRTFTITAKNNSSKNIYIQSAKLNGKKYTKSYIMYEDIMRGGKLEFTMGSKPSSYGIEKADRP